ncbi:WD40 repeat-like protein [Ascodesmis nigricans]|uniref:WD40 repeat-like protein n=1 Tax=Ascodesmis nigricans TaxID=341454 RepID=A0A4S2MWD1_9PEZI|nr:WD40 repeat-like protein [Ascodesmis nigricans]
MREGEYRITGLPRRQEPVAHPVPRPLPTPSRPIVSPLQNLLPSAPASPPTPAPSPTPQIHRLPTWTNANENEDTFLRDARPHFSRLDGPERQRFLAEILNLCDSQQLSFVLNYVSPRLKKDPFTSLPNELCLRVLSFIDDPKTLARASQVSKHWHALLSDDLTWKKLCEKHSYRRLSGTFKSWQYGSMFGGSSKFTSGFNSEISPPATKSKRPKATSYKSHFKQRYMVETAWRTGGKAIAIHETPDQGVVTSLHLTPDYIVIALDNAKIHVFDSEGNILRTLAGHVMGVWAMVPWGKTLVSGGCDRDVRVWDMESGECKRILRGHTSTVRCLKMSDHKTAVSGSRDTTLRIWDIEEGVCKNVLVGHQASVRCLEIHGDLVVSGSYDTTARVWSISQGTCLRTLSGHFSQIYAIAFDGVRIATGSLDTSVRIWDPQTGHCQAVLQGHTSLVGQLQMRGSTLVTGGSDGSVRVWSLEKNSCIHRLAAHDNSVTSLQFDDTRIVSGGSDGRVKVWDLRTGLLVRELSSPAQAVWRVAFEDEKAVILASRSERTTMEVYSFSPPPEALNEYYHTSTPTSERSSAEHERDTIMDEDTQLCGVMEA